jgi:carboxyl-terminal processing protease
MLARLNSIRFFQLFLSASVLLLLCAVAPAQSLSYNRDMGHTVLAVVQSDIKKNYYDPTFHGLDLAAHFKAADEKIKTASSLNEILGIIAAAVMELKDSHTYFVPPRRVARVEHGWEMRLIGDKAYIIAVQPGSDAETKGLAPGDRVLTMEGMVVSRKNLSDLQYIFYLLAPRTAMRLFVEKPTGERRELTVDARVHEGKLITSLQTGMASDRIDLVREYETLARLYRHRYYEIDDALIWKMPEFDLEESQVNELMDKAKKRKALLLDLRGNHGGSERTLLALIGNLFDHNVTVGEMNRRSEKKPLIAKSRGANAFSGKVIVLIDSASGSAAEVLAHLVQQEKRGTVIGDQSSGHVMVAKTYDHDFGQNLLFSYSMSVTDADLLDADGKSLEKVGVKPDELMLPTAADLAAGRDPVLAYGAKLAGLTISPEKAGAMFPVEWRKN